MFVYLIMATTVLLFAPHGQVWSNDVKCHMRVRKCCDVVCTSGGYLAIVTTNVDADVLFSY